MKVLIVCSGNAKENNSTDITQPFVYEQICDLKKAGISFEIFQIRGRGYFGYLKNLRSLKQFIKNGKFDLIHAHYGLSGLLAALQFYRPLVVTFHGSDINTFPYRLLSSFAFLFSSSGIFVSAELVNKQLFPSAKKTYLIPCGVNMDTFYPMGKEEARRVLDMDLERKYLLFSSSFDNPLKNYALAKACVDSLKDVRLIELKNRSREEVNLLLNACDGLLMTSFNEGSAQIIKEAMACNCPIVSTEVGDVREIIGTTEGCFISSFNPEEVIQKIHFVLVFSQIKGDTRGRERIVQLGLDSESVTKRIIMVYKRVLD